MNFTTVFNQVVVLFIILFVGYASRRKGILSHEMNKGFTELLLNVAIPFTIISAFNQDFSGNELLNALVVVGLALFIHLFSIAAGKLLYYRFDGAAQRVLLFTAIFSNCAFMGYPVAESMFGKTGILYVAAYSVIFNLFVWTYGQLLISGEKDPEAIKNVLMNPATIAIFIGIGMFFFPYKLPATLSRAIDTVGSMTTPLSMVIIGSMLAEVNLKELFSGYQIYYSAAVRLLVIPLSVLGIFRLVGLSGNAAGICVIITAMPAASFTAIFAEKFNTDPLLASRLVFFSTALSIFTIPAILLLL